MGTGGAPPAPGPTCSTSLAPSWWGDVAGACTIGLDFGTNSVRAVVVDCGDGHALGTAVSDYSSGERGVLLDPRDPHLARQHPGDYLTGLERAANDALAHAESERGFSRTQVVGIGSDTTGSTPLPVDAQCVPLALERRWRDHL